MERSYAVYKQYLSYGIVKGDIEKACAQAPQILYSSHYADHIRNWMEYFEDMYFLSFEQLEHNELQTLQKLCAYLELPFQKPRRGFDWRVALPQIWLPKNVALKAGKSDQLQEKIWLKKALEGERQRFNNLIKKDIF